MTEYTEPAVWIGCMACYNEGQLVGDWYPAAQAAAVTPHDIHSDPALAESHDELWCYDHEGIPVSGELDPMTATAWAEHLAEVPEHLREALCAWVRTGEYVAEGTGDLPSIPAFEDRFCGTWGSFRDYAENLVEEMGLLNGASATLTRYIDWDRWSRDLAHDYTTVRADALSVYVFRSL